MSDSGANFVPIGVDVRFWQLAKQMSIQRLEDVFVEILTNSNDAYDRMANPPEKRIFIVDIFGMDAQKVAFVDHAIGMTADIMERCLLRIGVSSASTGASTSTSSAVRGYFGRGAKDSTAAGQMTFESIRDDAYSRCVIRTDGTAALTHRNVPVTQDLRAALKIPSGSGTRVQLDVLESYRVASVRALYENVTNGVALRDLMSLPVNEVLATLYYDQAGVVPINQTVVKYAWPTVAETVFDKTYEVPGYPGVFARFVLNRSETQLPEARFDSEMQYGILIRSEKSIHEATVLRPAWRYHIAMPYLFGSITCNYLMTLMEDLEVNGSSKMNPFAILDPARKGGINVDHPFISRLYSIPATLLESYLPYITDMIDDSFIVDGSVQSLIENLQVFAADVLKKDTDFMHWQKSENGEFVRALQDIKEQYIKTENDTFPLLTVVPPDQLVEEDETQDPNMEVVKKTDDDEEEFNALKVIERGTLANEPPPSTRDPDQPERPELIAFVKNSTPMLQIKFSQQDNPAYQYNVYRTRDQIVIIIHIKYPLIAKYFAVSDETNTIDLTRANATFLADTISEALSRLLVLTDSEVKDMSLQNLNPTDTVLRVFQIYERKHKELDKAVDDHIDHYLATHVKFLKQE